MSLLSTLYWSFPLLVILTVGCFVYAARPGRYLLMLVLGWAVLQSVIAATGFYGVTGVLPPRFLLVIGPGLLFVLYVGAGPGGRGVRSRMSAERLHYLHLVRIPVETIFLYNLYREGLVALDLTFGGSNWDIVPGVLVPLVGYLYYRKKWLSGRWVLAVNVFGFGSLLWTMSLAVRSAPGPLQQLSFNLPTVAPLYFPFVLLPAVIVPLVLTAHLLVLTSAFYKSDLQSRTRLRQGSGRRGPT